MKGFASYQFLGDIFLDFRSLVDISAPLERNIFIDFAWNDVTKVLQKPPPTCAVNLVGNILPFQCAAEQEC